VGQKKSDPGFFENIWNSKIVRALVPDVITFDINYSAALGVGGSETYTLNLITRGRDAGLYKTTTMQRLYGAEFGYGANLGHLYYRGDVSTLTAQTILGPTRTISGGLGVDGNLTAGYQDENSQITNPSLVGYSLGVGLTLGSSYGTGRTNSDLGPFNLN
jgi:hypothetical protein